MIALAIQNKVDGFCRLRTHERMVEIGPRTQGQIGQPIEGVPRGLCVDGRKRSAVACVHGLQQVIAALIAYLAHDDAVGTMPESGGQKLARRDGDLAGDSLDCLPANGVRMCYLQLGWLLDHYQALVVGDVIEERFH